jgi:hypothetical protein
MINNKYTNKKDYINELNFFSLKEQFKTHDNFIDFVIKTFDLYSLSLALMVLSVYFKNAKINSDIIKQFNFIFYLYYSFYGTKFNDK